MVDQATHQTDGETVIATKRHHDQTQPSLKRWFKHLFYFKSSKSVINPSQAQQIADAIRDAEQGHRGEIQVIIEGSLPNAVAFEHNCQQRAEQLFAEYRVWDTEYNSGVLIYLNLCEHDVEIVADRGIHQAVTAEYWQTVCQSMLPFFKEKQFADGICHAVAQLGETLNQFYQQHESKDLAQQPDPQGNELSDMPKLL
ncbi:TLP18.3, Psb32 and MOLO-1 founding protein of phosphatase [Acinetobacter marinus]|uniref:TLP18.3, Psb32 and MOLO-1 founding protein of phosphatase n=1 Tax=Acinetobacter marinus TaxID=281375 RepID=A0A1G6KFX0_9GAMM|nr:TPM domain-containing protein [Acinetobacter marinus]SDC29817.1 TLP18.3, Psb32 and MOLO-1 founding protein of phosphatase [Acinetobacter marinus]